jgi:cyclopropane fatty-acyl-phospholipid synthase-like methyltransferase
MSVKPTSSFLPSSMGTPDLVKQRVVDYYANTIIDYQRILNASDHLGCHYGYYDYDNRTSHDAILNMNRQLAVRTGITAQSRVFDAGCGIGGSAIWLADNLGAQVSGLTLSKEQCTLAVENARQRGVDQLTDFSVGDYCSTPFEDHSFDVVWAIESVCYADSKAAFLRETARLLAPGGKLIIADGFRAERNLPDQKEKILRDWLSGWAVADLETGDEMLHHCAEAGLANAAFEDITENVMPFARYLLNKGILWAPVTHLLRYSGLLGRIRFENSQSTIRQYRALKQNTWKYGIVMAHKPPTGV